DFGDVVRRHVDEFRAGIDEAADQPRTGNAIDLGVLAGHPLVLRCIALAPGRQLPFFPAGDAAVEISGLDAGALQRLGDALAVLAAVDAINHHFAVSRQIGVPAGGVRRSANGADDHAV